MDILNRTKIKLMQKACETLISQAFLMIGIPGLEPKPSVLEYVLFLLLYNLSSVHFSILLFIRMFIPAYYRKAPMRVL